MNILFVADVSISEVIGGAERVLNEQTTRLAARGHNVFILTRKLKKLNKDFEIFQGVNEHRYDCTWKNPLTFIYSTWVNSKIIFEQLHQKINFDCINIHQPFSALGVIHSSLSARTPKIYTCHSISHEEFMSRNGNGHHIFPRVENQIQSLCYKRAEKDVLNIVDEVVVLSNYTKEKLTHIHKMNKEIIQVVPGGVDLNKFFPAINKNKIRKQLNIPQEKVILFTVRNLVQNWGLKI